MMATTDTKAKLNAQIHAGRRAKLRERFTRDGLDTFNECEVIEFALGFCIPRMDTNPAAHALLNKYGSLARVIDAKPADLQQCFGIGKNAAVFLNFLQQFTSYLAKQNLHQAKITTPEQATNYLRPLMKTYSVEQCVIICLDNAGKVKNIHNITNQELDQVHVNLREIISLVTATKAAQVLIAHNHLNEDPQPSIPDMQLTRRLVTTFENLGVKFLDHLIFAGEQTYSFALSGLLATFNKETAHR